MVTPPLPPAKASADDLLDWYDRHRRALPWRALPGTTPDPYRVWMSEIMLQQTTVRAVKPYFEKFLTLFPTVSDLADAPTDAVMTAWAGLGYYSRARNLHACAKAVVERHGGVFPADESALRALPGIGEYTAAAIASIAFGLPAVVVDGNVERVIARVHAVEEPLPGAKPLIKRLTAAIAPAERPGDFAQAMMDLGATICTPKSPACGLCPWREPCTGRREGTADTFPRKTPKREGVPRRGAAFVALREDGAILLGTREPKGLLGGMAEVPGTVWSSDHDATGVDHGAPLPAAWKRSLGTVTHVFTHFPLELDVHVARIPAGTDAPAGLRWVATTALGGEALPSVMRKVVEHGLAALGVDARQR